MKNYVIGVDVSKKTLDLCIMNGKEILTYEKITNTIEVIEKTLTSILKKNVIDVNDVIVCAEHTGIYTYPLTVVCNEKEIPLWLESGFNIKCEARKERGKDDRTDARRIAEYARKNQDDARIYKMPSEAIQRIRYLLSEREGYVTYCASLQGQMKDSKNYMASDMYSERCTRAQKLIDEINRVIKKIEDEIKKVISSDEELKRQDKLLKSIPGIGDMCSISLIATTAGFTLFSNGRELCCYAGFAPFSYTSGTSIRSKRKVSNRADHHLKSILHMCALVASTRMKDNPFAEYYKRKIAENKNPMSVINAVRAKMMQTAFAVIRDNNPYDKNYVYKVA